MARDSSDVLGPLVSGLAKNRLIPEDAWVLRRVTGRGGKPVFSLLKDREREGRGQGGQGGEDGREGATNTR